MDKALDFTLNTLAAITLLGCFYLIGLGYIAYFDDAGRAVRIIEASLAFFGGR